MPAGIQQQQQPGQPHPYYGHHSNNQFPGGPPNMTAPGFMAQQAQQVPGQPQAQMHVYGQQPRPQYPYQMPGQYPGQPNMHFQQQTQQRMFNPNEANNPTNYNQQYRYLF
jgi:hypothetical protein